MISLLDIAERIQKGPKMEENTWNMGLFKKMQDLTRKYELFYPKDNPVFNVDDSMADRAFQAAIEFITDNGAYCITTGRVLQLSEREVLSTIKGMPREVIIGEGKDRRVVKRRQIEEREEINHCPGHHAPFEEELAPYVVRNIASLPTADYLEGFNFSSVDGREVYGLPMEVYAAKRQAAWMRQGIAKAGRPGLAIASYPISTRSAALIAPIDPVNGLRPCDGILLSTLPDVKIDQDYLNAAMVWEEYGGFKVNTSASGQVGGFCGDVSGAMLEAIVNTLIGWIVYRDVLHMGIVGSVALKIKEIPVGVVPTWAMSVCTQALHRHTNYIAFTQIVPFSGPGCESSLLESAIQAITAPINGCNVSIPRQALAKMNASQSPLEAIWAHEVAEAVMRTGLTRQSAGDLLLKIGEKLKGRPIEAPYNDIREFYDVVHNKPLPQYEEIYLKTKDDLAALGLNFG
jgi:hypothetical protein